MIFSENRCVLLLSSLSFVYSLAQEDANSETFEAGIYGSLVLLVLEP